MPSVQLTTSMKSKCEIIWKTGLKELDEAKDIPSSLFILFYIQKNTVHYNKIVLNHLEKVSHNQNIYEENSNWKSNVYSEFLGYL